MRGESNKINNNLQLINSRPTWTNFLKRWISVSIRHSSHEGFISKETKLFRQTKNIYPICFDLDNHYYYYGKHRKVLCGSLKIKKIETIYNTWTFQTPSYSCTNISIIELPTSDQLLQDKFELTITFLDLQNNSSPPHQIVLSQSYEPFSVITDTSISVVSLNITQVSEMSKLIMYFQAIECGLLVTKNMPVIHYNRPLQFKLPYAYFPMNDITEYHVIVRTEIGTRVRLEVNCSVLNSFKFYDGPSLWASTLWESTLAKPFYEGSDELCKITSTFFQMYIVYSLLGQSNKYISNIVYYEDRGPFGPYQLFDLIHFPLGLSLSWDISNMTEEYYDENIVIFNPINIDEHLSYSVYIEKTVGPQGYLCQYGGLYIKDYSTHNMPNSIGPICSDEYADLIHKIGFPSSRALVIILYAYGSSFSQKGMIIFSGSYECYGIINPCAICTSVGYSNLVYTKYRGNMLWTCLKANDILITLPTSKECFTFLVVPNESSIKQGTCNMMIISIVLKEFQLKIIHRYTSSSGSFYNNQTVFFPSAYDLHTSKYRSIIESTSKYVSLFPHINFEIFHYKTFLSIETKIRAQAFCQDVLLKGTRKQNYMPRYDYEGICFNFKAILMSTDKKFEFSVHYSKKVDLLTNYMNRFLVLAWIDFHNLDHINTTSGQSLNMSITDEILMEDKPLQFHFTGQQLPLVWKSFGQALKIQIIAGQQLKNIIRIHVSVTAIFDVDVIYGFFWPSVRAYTPCHINATHVTSDSCWTVHKDFQGNWNSASEICKTQGGHLWSVNSDKEWNEVLTSQRYHNLEETQDRQYLQPINAMRYFRSSSLIYLGLKSDRKVRTLYFFFF